MLATPTYSGGSPFRFLRLEKADWAVQKTRLKRVALSSQKQSRLLQKMDAERGSLETDSPSDQLSQVSASGWLEDSVFEKISISLDPSFLIRHRTCTQGMSEHERR